MNEQPDAAWRLKWLQSKDCLEIEAWAVGEKGYKIALSPSGSRIVVQKARKRLWR
jgi:hypothetical protein